LADRQLQTPVVFIVFRRPETTKVVFEEIRKASPTKLFIISDAPRNGIYNDIEKCNVVRNIVENVDWNCVVKRNYAEKNMGCGPRVASGLNWVFNQVESAIILEDDCLPCQAFFRYCEELLKRYWDDTRIMHISGTRWNPEFDIGPYSYIFSQYAHIWGWATWKRAWQTYDYKITSWKKIREQIKDYIVFKSKAEERRWFNNWDKISADPDYKNAWSFQWQYNIYMNNGLCINPKENLISNIGSEGTRSNKDNSKNPYLYKEIDEKYNIAIHPTIIAPNILFDKYHLKNHIEPMLRRRNVFKRIMNKISRIASARNK
jgi:hypothetical protein